MAHLSFGVVSVCRLCVSDFMANHLGFRSLVLSFWLWAGQHCPGLQGHGILCSQIMLSHLQSKAASDTRLARDIKQAEDKAEADAAEEQRLRQEEMDSIDR